MQPEYTDYETPRDYALGYSPVQIGLPAKFRSWRPYQEEAITRILESPKRFVSLSVPTGGGKSVIYAAASMLSNSSSAILTSTKGLQGQLLTDFASVGLVDVRGRNNYRCCKRDDKGVLMGLNCEEGSLSSCSDYRLRRAYEGGPVLPSKCPYRQAVAAAIRAPLLVTNYAYWCAVNHYVQKDEAPLGSRDILILDEAHDCMDEVCNAVSFRILNRSVDIYLNRTSLPADRDDINAWVSWAKALQDRASMLSDRWKASAEDTKAAIWHRAAVNSLVSSILSLTSLRGTWVVDPVIDRTRSPIGYSFCPVWPDQYAESVLFIGIPKVLLVSATILPKTMKFLGVDNSEYEHLEFPSTFPSSRSPVYSVPTARCSHKMTDEAERIWIDRIDEIISKRLDRRGVIHTTSYMRRDHIMARSRYARFMVVHESGSEAAMAQADVFRRMDPPAILLSPSVTTGYDFAYDACEYVILTKVPFPDTRSPLTAARCGRSFPPGSPERTLGSEWELYTTIQTLVQGAGRGMRAADDQCEIFIIDDQFSWVFGRNKHLFPQWFRRMVETRRIVPVPPRTLSEQLTNNQPTNAV